MPVLDFPPVPLTPVLDCLRRLPQRQVLDRVGGSSLWLPRLGVTVLPHDLVTSGWICTLVAADGRPSRLPTGVFVVSDLEVMTAIGTCSPWCAVGELSIGEFCDAWRVRLAAARVGSPMLGEALLSVLDSATLTLDEVTGRAVLARSGCRTVMGLRQACKRLSDAGLLAPPSVGAEGPAGRLGLRLPDPVWPC